VEELQLEAISGNAAGFRLSVRDRLVFGRQNQGPGSLANDPELSRLHAQIERDPSGHFLLQDLASTNGTWVNGARIAAPTLLAMGDEIELGGSKLVVRSLPAPGPAPDVDVRAATVVGSEVPAAMEDRPAEPQADSEAEPAARMVLSFQVDPAGGELRIAIEDGETLQLRRDGGRWQLEKAPAGG
jgi:predicted component of type VI protein secretion system